MARENAVEKKVGVLLVNLGSPDAPTRKAVKRYLKEFLWDPRVVNIPRPIWWVILHFLVLPFRPKKAVKAYKKIWQEQGSPLVFLSQSLTDKVGVRFSNQSYSIDCVMRYGKPSLSKQLTQYKKDQVDELIVIPLYPQNSSTTTASIYDVVVTHLSQWWHIPSLRFISDYHQNPFYISAIVNSIKQSWLKRGKNELLILSFHGLPEQLIEWGDPYFDQCNQTANLIANSLSLPEDQWKVVFQSRFGKAKWLQPYCVEVLKALPKQGIKNIDIICPGFAVDCLETLEEIEMENRQVFMEAGGESYQYIPALNDTDQQVDLMIKLITGDENEKY